MVDTNLSIKSGFSLRALFGGGKTQQGSVHAFKRAKTTDKPKVASQHRYKGDHVLTRKGHRGALLLGRLVKGDPGGAIQRKKNQVAPQGQGGQVQRGQVQGGQVQGGQVQGGQIQGGQIQGGQVQGGQAPAKTFAEKLGDLQKGTTALEEGFRTLLMKDVPRETLATPKERLAQETALVGDQLKLKGDAAKQQAVVGDLLADRRTALATARDHLHRLETTDPVDAEAVRQAKDDIATLEGAIGELLKLRDRIVATQIGAEFPRLGANLDGPLTKGGVMTALWSLHNASHGIGRPGVGEATVRQIGRMIDEFGTGREPVLTDGGEPFTLAEFRDALKGYGEALGNLHGQEASAKARGEIDRLVAEIGTRLDCRDAVASFGRILDKDPKFPLGGAMRSIASALPNIRDNGDSLDPARRGRAAEGLSTLAGMIRDGETFEGLQGHDADFDRACLPFEQEHGARLSVATLTARLERDYGPLPKDILDLAHKKEEDLTPADRDRLVDHFSPLRRDLAHTLAECRALREAPAEGRKAAQLRHELGEVNRRLADVLSVDRRRWYKPWTWGQGAVRVFNGAPSSIRKDAALLKALKSFGNEASGRDVAFLMARIANLEAQTLKAEHNALGLHPGLDLASLDPQPGSPLAHVGISNEDLRSIGVTPTDLAEVETLVGQMNRQGVGGVDDVHQVTKSINDVARIVLKSELTQGMIDGYQAESNRALGSEVLDILVGDADLRYRKAHLMPVSSERTGGRSGLSLDDPTVSGHFKGVAQQIRRDLSGGDPQDPVWTGLADQGRQYRGLEDAIVEVYQDYRKVEDRIEASRKVIADANADDQRGIKVSADDPRGLRSAKSVLAALKIKEEYDAAILRRDLPAARDAERRMNGVLDDLRGYDTGSMHRSGWTKMTARLRERPEIGELARLKDVCEAIVYIRETGPSLLEKHGGEIETGGGALDDLVAQRREAHPKAMGQVTDMVRAAVLSEWANGGFSHAKSDLTVKDGVSETFDPASDPARKSIENRLKGWGLDLDTFAPEIDSVLYSRMSASDMRQWFQEANLSSETVDRIRVENPAFFSKAGMVDLMKSIGHGFTPDGLLNRKVMDESTKSSLISMLSSFQEGDKLDLRAGQRITLDSGKIPVEPTGLVGIKAKLSGAHIGQFEIERGSDGFKLHLRTGGEARGNLDLVVGKKFDMAPGVELTAEGSVGVEGSVGRLSGVSISFANSPEGCQAMVNLVAKMVDGGKIDLWDWQDATDVGGTTEDRGRIGANAQVTGRAQVGGKGPKLSGVSDTLGVGVQAQAQVGISTGRKDVTTESQREITRKGEVDVTLTAGANVSVYARLYNPLNMGTGALAGLGGQQGANQHFGMSSGSDGISGTSDDKPLYNITDNVQNTDLVGLGVSTSVSYVSKWKQVSNPDGTFKKVEKVRQANVSQGLIQSLAAVDTPEMQRILNAPGNEGFRSDFQAFMKLMGPRDFIAVTYNIRPERLAEANEMIVRANASRRQGDGRTAERLERQARAIVNDDANYVPAKIGLITTSLRKEEVTNLNARWLKWDSFSDGKAEHTGVTLQVPPPK
ncbi:hypothetical protein [Prosthecomicrobium hirschii]|uniref:hypothetical protein n=1 Tax=Prosthecodimorpha hirschii TaxID=665126 RepID=UPI00221F4132|nr:hypothetical protein [Prosthecomicrobium hirschii]MCW1840381.1 hypothetical protein [Prosthecomicrobium hirschii]